MTLVKWETKRVTLHHPSYLHRFQRGTPQEYLYPCATLEGVATMKDHADRLTEERRSIIVTRPRGEQELLKLQAERSQ